MLSHETSRAARAAIGAVLAVLLTPGLAWAQEKAVTPIRDGLTGKRGDAVAKQLKGGLEDYRERKWGPARKKLEAVLAADPAHPLAVAFLANILVEQGEFTYAEALIRRAGDVAPKPQPTLRLIQWHVIGPFPNQDPKGFNTAYGPEKDPFDAAKTYKPAGADVAWQVIQGPNVILHTIMKPPDNGVAYGRKVIRTTDAGWVQMGFGSDDGIKVWLNGAVIWNNHVHRGMRANQDRFWVRLKKGDNVLLAKVCQGGGGWGFVGQLNFGIPRVPVAFLEAAATGQRRLEANDVEGAIESFNEAQRLRNGTSPVLAGLAEAYYRKGFYPTARSWLTRALQRSPSDPRALTLLGQVLARQGAALEASEAFQDAVKSGGELFPSAFLALAKQLEVEGKFQEALESYRQAGEGFARTKDFGQALEAYAHYRHIQPRNRGVNQRFGQIQRLAGRTAQAEKTLLEQVRGDPRDPKALRQLAAVYRDGNDRESAVRWLAVLDRLAELLPKDPEIARQRIEAAYRAGRPNLAGDLAIAAMQAFPKNPGIRVTTGWNLVRLGDLAQAANVARAAREAFPEHPGVALLAGRVAIDRGELDEAGKLLALATTATNERTAATARELLVGLDLEREEQRERRHPKLALITVLSGLNLEESLGDPDVMPELAHYVRSIGTLYPRVKLAGGRTRDDAGRPLWLVPFLTGNASLTLGEDGALVDRSLLDEIADGWKLERGSAVILGPSDPALQWFGGGPGGVAVRVQGDRLETLAERARLLARRFDRDGAPPEQVRDLVSGARPDDANVGSGDPETERLVWECVARPGSASSKDAPGGVRRLRDGLIGAAARDLLNRARPRVMVVAFGGHEPTEMDAAARRASAREIDARIGAFIRAAGHHPTWRQNALFCVVIAHPSREEASVLLVGPGIAAGVEETGPGSTRGLGFELAERLGVDFQTSDEERTAGGLLPPLPPAPPPAPKPEPKTPAADPAKAAADAAAKKAEADKAAAAKAAAVKAAADKASAAKKAEADKVAAAKAAADKAAAEKAAAAKMAAAKKAEADKAAAVKAAADKAAADKAAAVAAAKKAAADKAAAVKAAADKAAADKAAAVAAAKKAAADKAAAEKAAADAAAAKAAANKAAADKAAADKAAAEKAAAEKAAAEKAAAEKAAAEKAAAEKAAADRAAAEKAAAEKAAAEKDEETPKPATPNEP